MANIFSRSVMGSDGVESGGRGVNLKAIGGVILVLALLIFAWMRLRSNTATISVIGTGEVEMIPETVSMIVTKVSSAGDATGAIDAGEAGISRLIATVRSTVGEGAEIKKSFYQVTPQSTSLFMAATGISVKTESVEMATQLIKALYAAGATTVSDVKFSSLDKATVEQRAREAAVADAKEKALGLAKASKKRLGKLLSITDDNVGIESSVGTETGSGMPTTINVVKNVSVIYEIL